VRTPSLSLAAALVTCLGLSSSAALVATYSVPGDSPTIQGALDMTVSGDSVICYHFGHWEMPHESLRSCPVGTRQDVSGP